MEIIKPYELKENEMLILQVKIIKGDEVLNIITVYQDEEGRVYIHNANGGEPQVCPNLRCTFIDSFYCAKYKESISDLSKELRNKASSNNCWIWKNPQYMNCQELGQDVYNYKECKYYKIEDISKETK